MKASGIIRRIDDLGRVTVSKEFRDNFGWNKGTKLEAFLIEDGVILKAYRPHCHLCGDDDVVEREGLKLCYDCVRKFKSDFDEMYSKDIVVDDTILKL